RRYGCRSLPASWLTDRLPRYRRSTTMSRPNHSEAPMKWPLVCGLAGAIFGYALGVQVWNVLVVFEFMPQTVGVLLLAIPYAALMAWASHRGGTVARWCWGMAAIGGFLGLVTVPLLAPRAAVHGMFNDVLYVTGPIGAAVGAVVGTAI